MEEPGNLQLLLQSWCLSICYNHCYPSVAEPCILLGRLVEEPGNLQLLVREDVALQQLVLAALGSSSLVVGQAVKVMAAAGSYAGAARRLVRHNVVQAITDLVASQDVVRRRRTCMDHGLGFRQPFGTAMPAKGTLQSAACMYCSRPATLQHNLVTAATAF